MISDTVMHVILLGFVGFLLAGPVVFFAFLLGGVTAGIAAILIFFLGLVIFYMLLVRRSG